MHLPLLKGRLINLRRLRRSDAGTIQRYANDPHVAHFLAHLQHPYSLDHAREWINAAHRLARQDRGYDFGIEHRSSGEIIGTIGLNNVNWKDKNSEVGYWVARQFWRRGVAAEAMRIVLGFGFSRLDLVRIYAVVHAANTASVKLLEKCGFIREGVWRKASFLNGRFHNVFAYGILREEFQS